MLRPGGLVALELGPDHAAWAVERLTGRGCSTGGVGARPRRRRCGSCSRTGRASRLPACALLASLLAPRRAVRAARARGRPARGGQRPHDRRRSGAQPGQRRSTRARSTGLSTTASGPSPATRGHRDPQRLRRGALHLRRLAPPADAAAGGGREGDLHAHADEPGLRAVHHRARCDRQPCARGRRDLDPRGRRARTAGTATRRSRRQGRSRTPD